MAVKPALRTINWPAQSEALRSPGIRHAPSAELPSAPASEPGSGRSMVSTDITEVLL